MALTDPAKFKEAAGTEVEAARVSQGNRNAEYVTSDGLNKLSVSTIETAKTARKRHLIRIDTNKLVTNPLEESKKEERGMSAYVVIDRPVSGFSLAEAKKLAEGLTGYLTAANLEKVLAGQS